MSDEAWRALETSSISLCFLSCPRSGGANRSGPPENPLLQGPGGGATRRPCSRCLPRARRQEYIRETQRRLKGGTDRQVRRGDTQSKKRLRGTSERSRDLRGRTRPANSACGCRGRRPHADVTSEEVGLQYPAPKTRFSRERPDCSGPASTPPLPSHEPLPGRVKLEERVEER